MEKRYSVTTDTGEKGLEERGGTECPRSRPETDVGRSVPKPLSSPPGSRLRAGIFENEPLGAPWSAFSGPPHPGT